MKHIYYLLFAALFCCFDAHAQTYYMGGLPSVTTCAGSFYDNGGQNGNYTNNQDVVMTFCSATPDSAIYFQFEEFRTESSFDVLYVYDGANTTAPLLHTMSGTVLPVNIVSSNLSNCLTFRFVSDGSSTYAGWKANIGCGTPPALPSAITNTCNLAMQLCAAIPVSITAATGTTAEQGPEYGCLTTKPNPIWFKLPIVQAGELNLAINSTNGTDVDFVVWGPYATGADVCNNLTAGNIIDCSYSSNNVEYANIANAQIGQTYILLVTNYANQPTNITITAAANTTAATACTGGPCLISMNNSFFARCTPADSTSMLSTFNLFNTIDSGALVISNNYGDSVIINAPFGTTIPYSATIPGSAETVNISAYFTANTSCSFNAVLPVNIVNLSATLSSTVSTHVNENTGTASVQPLGGMPPYAVLWSNGGTTETISNLYSGMYYVTVTDAKGCTISDSVFVAYTPCGISLNSQAYFCNLGNDAFFAAIYYNIIGAPSQGNLVFEVGNANNTASIAWPFVSNNFQYTTPAFHSNTPLYVTAYFTADTACRVVDTAAIYFQGVGVSFSVTNSNNLAADNGIVTAQGEGGSVPYTYEWSNSFTGPTISGLAPGTYTVTVTDARDCETTASATVANTYTGIENIKQNLVSITPNPATTQLHFEFTNAFAGEGFVYGTDGKLFDTFAINNQTETLNIAGLPAGVYIVHVKDNATNATSYTRAVKY